MLGLEKLQCTPCSSNTDKLDIDKVSELLKKLPAWNIVSNNNIDQLEASFKFNNFLDAMHFANQVSLLAEVENHHPSLLIEWGKVRVNWWTHAINGLHINDFILAAKTSSITQT